jgi:hypothetical protein
MNTKPKSHETEFAARSVPKPKTLNLRPAQTGRGFRSRVHGAFGLAKSAGMELDLTFAFGAS